jgi:hypothetical protein
MMGSQNMEVIDEYDGEYRTALPKKKGPMKKGDLNRNYNSSMGVNNDIGNVQNQD